ncbi:MAG TPA: hypothetical protein VGN88_03120 [Phycisphaerae bacterium]|jgi:hypothetical protein
MPADINYHSPRTTKFRRLAQVYLFLTGGFFLLAGIALPVGMISAAILPRHNSGLNLSSPSFYLTLLFFTVMLLAIGSGLLWTRRAVVTGSRSGMELGKYLLYLLLIFFCIEAAGIACGLILDPPKGADAIIAAAATALNALLVAVLALCLWSLQRARREWQSEASGTSH